MAPDSTLSNVPASVEQSNPRVAPRVAPPVHSARPKDQRPPSFGTAQGWKPPPPTNNNNMARTLALPRMPPAARVNDTALKLERERMRQQEFRDAHLMPSPAGSRFAAQIARENGLRGVSGYQTRWGYVSIWALSVLLGASILSLTASIAVLVTKAKQTSNIDQGILFWAVLSIVLCGIFGTATLVLWARKQGYLSKLSTRLGLDEVGLLDRTIRHDRDIDTEANTGSVRGRVNPTRPGAYGTLHSQTSLASFGVRDLESGTDSRVHHRQDQVRIPPRPEPAYVRTESRFPATSLRQNVPALLVHSNDLSNGSRNHRQKDTTTENPFADPPNLPKSPLEGLHYGVTHTTVRNAPEHVRQSMATSKRDQSNELSKVHRRSIERPSNTNHKRAETISSMECEVDFHTGRIEEHELEEFPRPHRTRTETLNNRTHAMLREQGKNYSRGMTDITAILNPKPSASSLGGTRRNLYVSGSEGHSNGRSKQETKRGEQDREHMSPGAYRTKNLDETQEGAYREIFAKGGRE